MNALIIGSSRGIGASIRSAFIQDGFHVWGMARSPQAEGSHFHPIRADFCEEFDGRLLPEIIDVLVICAGTQKPIGTAMEIHPADWLDGIRNNLFGAYNSIYCSFERLKRAKHGKVIVFSGGGATAPRPQLSAYAVAKCGIVRLVDTLAEEWRRPDFNLSINAIAPGAIYTAMTDEILALDEEQVGIRERMDASQTKLADNKSAMATAVECVRWLAGPESNGITGKLIAAKWDDWKTPEGRNELAKPGRFVLRRVT